MTPPRKTTDPANPPPGKRLRTREQILDAAVDCFAECGVNQCNMVDVAARAGVGRSTLYRHFPNLEDIIVAALLRDMEDLLANMKTVRAGASTIDDQIAESYLYLLQEIPRLPVMGMLFTQDAAMVETLSLEAEEFHRLGAQFSQENYEEAKRQGRLREGVTLEEFVEWSTRLLLSLCANPYQHANNRKRMRQYLRRFVLPSLLTGY